MAKMETRLNPPIHHWHYYYFEWSGSIKWDNVSIIEDFRLSHPLAIPLPWEDIHQNNNFQAVFF